MKERVLKEDLYWACMAVLHYGANEDVERLSGDYVKQLSQILLSHPLFLTTLCPWVPPLSQSQPDPLYLRLSFTFGTSSRPNRLAGTLKCEMNMLWFLESECAAIPFKRLLGWKLWKVEYALSLALQTLSNRTFILFEYKIWCRVFKKSMNSSILLGYTLALRQAKINFHSWFHKYWLGGNDGYYVTETHLLLTDSTNNSTNSTNSTNNALCDRQLSSQIVLIPTFFIYQVKKKKIQHITGLWMASKRIACT